MDVHPAIESLHACVLQYCCVWIRMPLRDFCLMCVFRLTGLIGPLNPGGVAERNQLLCAHASKCWFQCTRICLLMR